MKLSENKSKMLFGQDPLSLNCIQVKFFDCIQDGEGLDWMHNSTIHACFATLQNVILLSDHLSFIWNSEEHSNLSCGSWDGMDLSQTTLGSANNNKCCQDRRCKTGNKNSRVWIFITNTNTWVDLMIKNFCSTPPTIGEHVKFDFDK